MPYISRELLRVSLSALSQHYSPLLTVSVPCMVARDLPVCSNAAEARRQAQAFGGRDEKAWLDEFFRFTGGPSGKPYFMPGTGEWVEDRYAERSLQRRRKDFEGDAFFHPDTSRWAFRVNVADVLKSRVLQTHPPIPLVALMSWMWRDREISSRLDVALSDFLSEYKFIKWRRKARTRMNLIPDVYTDDIPAEYADAGLSPVPLTHDEIAELIGAAPESPVLPDLMTAIAQLEAALNASHFIAPPGLVQRIVGGWLVDDIVVLVGPTGSGKTTLSRALASGLGDVFGNDRLVQCFLEIAPDFDAAQFLGYENLAGHFNAGRFAKEVLFVGAVSDPRLIVLDEWNLAQIDAYFAPILSVIESGRPLRLPGRVNLDELDEDLRADLVRAQPTIASGQVVLPENSFFLATCNSWTEEPETRLPISGPVKRRCRIIPMPNALAVAYADRKQGGIIETCNTLIRQERAAVERRQAEGNVSVWDRHRLSRLNAIPEFDRLSGETRGKLLQICKALLDNPLTRDGFTPGILRDVLLSCVYANDGDDLAALGEQVADKVIHQIRGEPKTLEAIADISKELPNATQIMELAKRMGAFAGERRIRPLI